MNDLEHKIVELIQQGEGLTLEFKECRNTLNRDVYETVCAFLNRHGGTLLLGIKDNGEILGVDQDRVDQIKKDFVTAINNPKKINPACYLSVNEATLQNKTVLSVYIPESSHV
ncbi:MAG: helix-turn-helix domain-containing protein [Chlorobium sp.]